MNSTEIGYREVNFRMREAKEILSNPELVEQISSDHREALQVFFNYGLAENLGDDKLFRLTLAPSASLTKGVHEMIQAMARIKRGEYIPFDDSAICEEN